MHHFRRSLVRHVCAVQWTRARCTWWISLSFSILLVACDWFFLLLFCFLCRCSDWKREFFHWKRSTWKKKEEEKKWSHASYSWIFFLLLLLLLSDGCCRRYGYATEMSVNSIKSTFESSIRIVKQWDKMSWILIICIIIIICTLSLPICMLACGWQTGLSCRRSQWINMTYFSTKHEFEWMNLNCSICIRKTEWLVPSGPLIDESAIWYFYSMVFRFHRQYLA